MAPYTANWPMRHSPGPARIPKALDCPLPGYDPNLLRLLSDSIYQTQMVPNPRGRAALIFDRLKMAGYRIVEADGTTEQKSG